MESILDSVCAKGCAPSQPGLDPGTSGAQAPVGWSVHPFGPVMGDFIFVPERDLHSDDPAVLRALGEIQKRAKSLHIQTKDTAKAIRSVDTSEARQLFQEILADDTLFQRTSVEGRTIDSRDPQWALALTNTQRAHDEFFLNRGKTPGEGVRIAVVDTGITEHPELHGVRFVRDGLRNGSGNFLIDDDKKELLRHLQAKNAPFLSSLAGGLEEFFGINNSLLFWGPFLNPNHGTSSVSLVASLPNDAAITETQDGSHQQNHHHVTGTAYGAEILVAKISNSVVLVSGKAAAKAILWATENGAAVITMSMGGLSTPELFQAIKAATEKGIIIVAAAGTGTGPVTVYPASYAPVVGVTSVDELCRADDQTAYSTLIDVAGPGKNAWFAWTLKHPKRAENDYRVSRAFGTSLSTPHVAGIAALWLAHHGRDALAARFGEGNIPWLFKYLLQADIQGQPKAVHDCDGHFGNNGNKYLGHGVPDSHALLSINLSAISPATIEDYKNGRLSNLKPPGGSLVEQTQNQIRAFQQSLLAPLMLRVSGRGENQEPVQTQD